MLYRVLPELLEPSDACTHLQSYGAIGQRPGQWPEAYAAKVIQLLIAAGADKSAKNNEGQTVADIAEKNGRTALLG